MLCKFQASTSHFFFHVKKKIQWNCCLIKAAPIALLNLSIIGLWIKNDIGTKQHVPNRILCNAAGLNRWRVLRKSVCSDVNWFNGTVQLLQMVVCKGLETMSGVILNQLQPKKNLKPNRSLMKCNVWKPCSDQRWQDELQFLIWRFFEQSAFVNNF